jgi:hypothetical protein
LAGRRAGGGPPRAARGSGCAAGRATTSRSSPGCWPSWPRAWRPW